MLNELKRQNMKYEAKSNLLGFVNDGESLRSWEKKAK